VRIRYLIAFHAGLLACLQPWHADAITLEEAMKIASEQHPLLQMAEQNIEVARGNLTEQGSYAYNPELSLEPQRRRLNAGGTSNDYYVTLSQGIEIGGKRGYREQSAQAALDAASQDREAARQRLTIEAARSFSDLYYAEQILDFRRKQSAMLNKVSQAVARQLEVGQSSQLDANLAQSAFGSALNATTTARQAFTQSRQRYFTALGKTQETENLSRLELPRLSPGWRPPKDSFKVALESRPDFSALRSKLAQSSAQADLASVERIPDITFSAMTGREAGENLIKLGVAIPFPVLNTHQGAYRSALAEKERTRTGLDWSEQRLRYEVRSALDNHANTMQALSGITETDMQRTGQETIDLAQKAYDAGELDLEELVVHIRQGLDARMTALDIIKQAWMARIRLAEVLGRPEYILEGTE